jgi:hypothetical protein
MKAEKLTNLQLEMLKVFSYDLNESQLNEIKRLIAGYFADNATKEMDSLWDNNNWSNQTMEKWSKEHLRTTYSK